MTKISELAPDQCFYLRNNYRQYFKTFCKHTLLPETIWQGADFDWKNICQTVCSVGTKLGISPQCALLSTAPWQQLTDFGHVGTWISTNSLKQSMILTFFRNHWFSEQNYFLETQIFFLKTIFKNNFVRKINGFKKIEIPDFKK